MTMKLVLVLSCVLQVSADGKSLTHFKLCLWLTCVSASVRLLSSVLHEDFHIAGCSESDAEDMYAVDSEQIWYADFVNMDGVDVLPDFADHPGFPLAYDAAVSEKVLCRMNLKTARIAYKDLPLELGENL